MRLLFDHGSLPIVLRHSCGGAVAMVVLLTGFVQGAAPRGEAIFQQQCARCHGLQGEGVKDHYPHALSGDRSVLELTALIADTMPAEHPEQCVGDDAAAVATYIHETFYSPLAQARNRPARIELSRLTVRQYENTVADLLGSFQQPGRWTDQRGLSGRYYASKRPGGKLVLERRDALVDFDFGDRPPAAELKPDEYSARWEGALLAPDTGEYEFVVETVNGASLWVNDLSQPLIDARVKSGDVGEYRQSIRLLGGRVYPIRLEYYKGKEPTGSIVLCWKPPQGVVEPIAERYLSPQRFPDVFVLKTRFPPDDRSIGFERGTSVSKEWIDATTNAAIEVAEAVAAQARRSTVGKTDTASVEKQYRDLAGKLVERAFRRPLTDADRQLFVERQFAAADNPETALKRVVLLTLKSPRFLYREVGRGRLDDYDLASWLSFSLWDSLPDEPLLEAARKGQLHTGDQLRRQAERMVADPRTRWKLRTFLHQWLHLDRFGEVAKDAKAYPEFDAQVLADLRVSLDLFLDDVIWQGSSDYRQLFLADYVYLNGRLAALYGAELPDDAPFTRVGLPQQQRAGVLTHPYLMTGFAYDGASSPIHRGVFVARSVLGRLLKPPPEAVTPIPPDLHAELTTRQRVELQTAPAGCRTCHNLINPLGFSLEHFDAIGRYRDEEKNQPIDASGQYLTRQGKRQTFAGSTALAAFLVSCDETHEAFVEQLFSYMVKQPIRAFGAEQLDGLRREFVRHDYHVRKLLVELTVGSALGARELAAEVVQR